MASEPVTRFDMGVYGGGDIEPEVTDSGIYVLYEEHEAALTAARAPTGHGATNAQAPGRVWAVGEEE